jgi:hypothetical protein
MRLLIIISLTAAAGLTFLASTASAAADVQVTALDCGTHPRRIRIENLGDQAVSLAGWELRSDPAEGEPFDLGQAGSLAAGQRIYVFNGHLAPPTDATISFYRWGVDDTFFLRANDSDDYVRVVDNQGNTADERHCEGVPGGTPEPSYTPPADPQLTPEPTTASATNNQNSTPAPRGGTGGGAGGSSTSGNTGAASNTVGPESASDLPAQGGPPPISHDMQLVPLITGIAALAIGLFLVTAGLRAGRRG